MHADDDGDWLTEDFAFCKRWRDVGGQVWGYPHADINHVGSITHTGNFAKYLKAASEIS